MIQPAEPTVASRTIAAHRTYILAVLACEKATHDVRCAICGAQAGARDDRQIRVIKAAAEKEACRLVFRDLLDELGCLPEGLTITLPESEDWSYRVLTRAHCLATSVASQAAVGITAGGLESS